ncbi:MAG TPA: TIGR04133 family radical SAM/SPASM protein [Prolixibacteraceae bacterium]|nr:TIGR04133 family radical SAM/SPASM protein [Prolixibacteraceae bacterium]
MSVTRIPLRKRIALNLYSNYKKNEARIHQLNYLFWECTLRCNLNCQHCGSDCSKEAGIKDMPLADFLKALDLLKGMVNPNKTIIVLTGGEVLMRNDLEVVGASLYERGFPWGMVTNGMLLTQKKLESLINCGLRSLTVSLDGFEESHNWLRGNKKSYQNAAEAIQLLPQYPELRYDVVTCANRMNWNELGELRDMLIRWGVAEWRLFTVFPIGRAKDNLMLQLSPVEFKSLFEFIKETRKQGKIKLNYGCEGFLGSYESEARDNFFFCRAGISVASVLADGSISACPSLRDNFIQGNIYKDNLATVWNTRFERYRDRSWTKTGECASCEFYKYCEGNGLHLRNEKTGELLFCHLHRIKSGE